MTRIILNENSDDRAAFLAARKGKLGSSEIATICCLNTYKTPLYLWSEMTGRIPEDHEENLNMWLGQKLEPIVAELFAKETGRAVKKWGATLGHDSVDWAIATPDYSYVTDQGESGILECKSTNSWNKAKWEDGIPDAAHIQLQWQLGILGFEFGEVAALADREFFHHPSAFQPLIFEQLLEMGQKFMDLVKSDTPPAAVDDDKRLITRITGDLIDETVLLGVEEMEALERLQQLKDSREPYSESLKLIDKQMDDIKAQLRMKMGNAARGKAGRWRLSQSQVNRKAHEVKASSYVTLKIKEEIDE